MELEHWWVRESVWLDNLFPLLTILPEKSAAERCWMVALTGCCRWETCKGQCPKYNQTLECIGAFGLASLSFVMCLFVTQQSFQGIQTKPARQFWAPLIFGATGQEHNINPWRSGSAGFVHTLVGIYHPSSYISPPMEVYLNSKNSNSIQQLGECLKYKSQQVAAHPVCSRPKLGFFTRTE